jgi:hypothetical protein
MSVASLAQARAAKARALEIFSRFGEVVGVGLVRVGEGYGVKVNLQSASTKNPLPRSVDGVPVTVEVVGSIRKRSGTTPPQA